MILVIFLQDGCHTHRQSPSDIRQKLQAPYLIELYRRKCLWLPSVDPCIPCLSRRQEGYDWVRLPQSAAYPTLPHAASFSLSCTSCRPARTDASGAPRRPRDPTGSLVEAFFPRDQVERYRETQKEARGFRAGRIGGTSRSCPPT